MTMTRLERNAQLHNVLRAMERAYEKGDFTEFVALLDEDCVYESMWVIERLHGREAVANHLLGKGNSISKSGSYPDCWIEEMVGNINPLPDTDIQENIKEKAHIRQNLSRPNRGAKILILDDSTSAVDTKTDAYIRKAFREEIPGTTKLIIAQRISSIQDADRIIVLNEGRIESVGTHEELLKISPIYQEVYNTQVKGGSEDGK